MNMSSSPANILIFGATGRLGSAVARQIRYRAPHVRLRLATSRESAIAGLAVAYPGHEVITADFEDDRSIAASFAGIDAAFLVTPNFLDETAAMARVASAIEANRDFRQLFRIVGDQPGTGPARVPQNLRDRPGPAMQHHHARIALEHAQVPACYLNIAALMSNLFANAPGIVAHDILAQPARTHGWIDSGDVGEAAARLILDGDERHTGQTYDLDNGHDVRPWSDVAATFSDVLLRSIAYDPTAEGFLQHVGPIYARKMGLDWAPQYFAEYFAWEGHHDPAWRNTDFVERILGRRARTLRSWIEANATAFAPQPRGPALSPG
ncbi:MAG: putative nucleoside-diphosphate sugar epimerase [Bradyrhizobium sp.]|nr:putative nucleoside-diphosphate sugar epimerase [Bradyrhizobium sp.]